MPNPEGSRKGDEIHEWDLGKAHGFCKGEWLGMLKSFQEDFGGSAKEGSCTSQGSEEDLEGP